MEASNVVSFKDENSEVEVPVLSPVTVKPGKIFSAINAANKAISAVAKASENQQFRFKYRSIDAIFNMIHPVLAEAGLLIVPNVVNHFMNDVPTKGGGSMIHTVVVVRYRIYAEDGSFFETETLGECMDSGDKSLGKAMLYALKYFLIQIFTIPTDDSEDADNTSPERGKPLERTYTSSPNQRPSSPRPAPQAASQAEKKADPAPAPASFEWKCSKENEADFMKIIERAKKLGWDKGKLQASLKLDAGLPDGNYTSYDDAAMGIAISEMDSVLTTAEERAAQAAGF